MKYIDINSNLKFRKEDIMGVERIDGTENCKILTYIGTYSCDWPFSTLMQYLEVEDSNINTPKREIPIAKNNLWGAQHFAG